MSSNTTALDPPAAATCPACGSEFAAGTTECSACQGRGRGSRHPAAKAAIGAAWFCSALVILWFFGSVAMAPWHRTARTGPMLLPWGGQFDLTLGRGASARCALQVTRDGQSSVVVIMQGSCSRVVAHRWLKANRQLPQFQGATLGVPYTLAAPPGAEETARRTRLLVSLVITVAAGLTGVLLTVGSVATAVKAMTGRY